MKELATYGATVSDLTTAVNQLIRGRSNAVGQFTMAANVTTTVVKAQNISTSSQVFLSPRTANAQVATWFITIQTGQFTVTHASTATLDRTFGFLVIG